MGSGFEADGDGDERERERVGLVKRGGSGSDEKGEEDEKEDVISVEGGYLVGWG